MQHLQADTAEQLALLVQRVLPSSTSAQCAQCNASGHWHSTAQRGWPGMRVSAAAGDSPLVRRDLLSGMVALGVVTAEPVALVVRLRL